MNNYQIVVFVLLCVLIDYFAFVQKMHCDNMCHSKSFNAENYRSLNEQLSLDGLNDHCEYIGPSLIKKTAYSKYRPGGCTAKHLRTIKQAVTNKKSAKRKQSIASNRRGTVM